MKVSRGILVCGMVAALNGACSGGSFFGGAGTAGQAKKASAARSADGQPASIEQMQNMPAKDYFEQTNSNMRDWVGDDEYDIGGITVSNLASTYEEIMNKAIESGLDGVTVKDLMGEYIGQPSDDELIAGIDEVFGKHAATEVGGEADTFELKSLALQAYCGSSSTSGTPQTNSGKNNCSASSGFEDGGAGASYSNPYFPGMAAMPQSTGNMFQQQAYSSYNWNGGASFGGAGAGASYSSGSNYGAGAYGAAQSASLFHSVNVYFGNPNWVSVAIGGQFPTFLK